MKTSEKNEGNGGTEMFTNSKPPNIRASLLIIALLQDKCTARDDEACLIVPPIRNIPADVHPCANESKIAPNIIVFNPPKGATASSVMCVTLL